MQKPALSKAGPRIKITVHLRDGRELLGFAQGWQPAMFNFTSDSGRKYDLARTDIARVTRKLRAKGALYGLLLGFGVGAAIVAGKAGDIVDKNNPRRPTGWGVLESAAPYLEGHSQASGLPWARSRRSTQGQSEGGLAAKYGSCSAA